MMIRVLHFVGVTSLIGACLVTGLCVFRTPQYDLGSMDLSSAIVSRSRQAIDNAGPRNDQEQDSALVRAAKEFALYLNPPVPVKPTRENPISQERSRRVAQAEPQPAPENTSAKFELRGISYHRARPEESMALIWVPGAGSSWVRQGARIGHMVVDKINGDSIECKDGQRVWAMSMAGQKPAAVVAAAHEVREKKPVSAPKNASSLTTAAPRPLLVRGMRQIPLVRLTANQP